MKDCFHTPAHLPVLPAIAAAPVVTCPHTCKISPQRRLCLHITTAVMACSTMPRPPAKSCPQPPPRPVVTCPHTCKISPQRRLMPTHHHGRHGPYHAPPTCQVLPVTAAAACVTCPHTCKISPQRRLMPTHHHGRHGLQYHAPPTCQVSGPQPPPRPVVTCPHTCKSRHNEDLCLHITTAAMACSTMPRPLAKSHHSHF